MSLFLDGSRGSASNLFLRPRTYKKLQHCTVNPSSTPGLCSSTSNGFRPSLCYCHACLCYRSGSECRSDQTCYMPFWASDSECSLLRSDVPPLLLLYSYVCLQLFSQSSTRSRRTSLMVASAVKRFVTKQVCSACSPFSTPTGSLRSSPSLPRRHRVLH